MTSSSKELEAIGLSVVMILICFVGVVSNIIVIYVTVFNKNMRGSTDIFVINLAVSDILLAGLALPLKLNNALQVDENFHGGDFGCKLIQFVPQFSIMCSISTMVAISFDRHFAIVYQKLMRLRHVAIVLVVVWLLSLATSAPQIYEYSVQVIFEVEENATEISCGSHGIEENFELVYACIILTVSYLLPMLLISVNYTRLGVFLWTRPAPTSGLANANSQSEGQVSRNKLKVLKMLVILTVLFAVLWMPYFILFTIEEITNTDNSSELNSAPQVAKHLMIAISTTTNPVLYSVFNKKFRDGLRRAFRCSPAVHPTETTQNTNTMTIVSSADNK